MYHQDKEDNEDDKMTKKKECAAAALDPESETFIVHVVSLSSNTLLSSSPLDVDPR